MIKMDKEPNRERFNEQQDQVALVYKQAFAGYPWFEDLSLDVVLDRLRNNQAKRGFGPFLAQMDGVIGGLWFDTPTLEELGAERGLNLQEFTAVTLGKKALVWEREVVVKPNQQRQGIATRLRTNYLEYLKAQYQEGALVLTRMREDNIGILKIAQKLGFQKTGIRKASSQNPNIYHDFYFKEV